MSALARRKMIQALIGAPLAAPVIAKNFASNALASASGFAAADFGSANTAPMPSLHPLAAQLGQSAYDALAEARHGLEEEERFEARFRIRGIDPDLNALRSVSPTYLALKQRERLREALSLHEQLRKALSW